MNSDQLRDEILPYWITSSDKVLKTVAPVSFPCGLSESPGVVSFHMRFRTIDRIEDSMVAETVSQCSYNTAYKALGVIRNMNVRSGRIRSTYLMLWCSVDFKIRSDAKN